MPFYIPEKQSKKIERSGSGSRGVGLERPKLPLSNGPAAAPDWPVPAVAGERNAARSQMSKVTGPKGQVGALVRCV